MDAKGDAKSGADSNVKSDTMNMPQSIGMLVLLIVITIYLLVSALYFLFNDCDISRENASPNQIKKLLTPGRYMYKFMAITGLVVSLVATSFSLLAALLVSKEDDKSDSKEPFTPRPKNKCNMSLIDEYKKNNKIEDKSIDGKRNNKFLPVEHSRNFNHTGNNNMKLFMKNENDFDEKALRSSQLMNNRYYENEIRSSRHNYDLMRNMMNDELIYSENSCWWEDTM